MRRITEAVTELLSAPVSSVTALSGGDVARSFRCDLADGQRVFAKTHDDPPPGVFITEASGLEWLRDTGSRNTGTPAVPEVLAVTDGVGPTHDGQLALLVLEWIDESRSTAPDEASFGRALAELHRSGAGRFGRDDRRATGSLQLPNQPCDDWAEFYATRRLLPLVRIARDRNAVDPVVLGAIEDIAGDLSRYGAHDEPPCLLHGDLWAGNRLVDRSARSWLIDPAVHGGHREFDLAMMRLFGGFGATAFSAYHDAHALADGHQRRIPLHQLAPLLVHAIKFAGPYPSALERAVSELGAQTRRTRLR